MSSGIHTPLGKDRKPSSARPRFLTAGRLLVATGIIVVLGGSIYPLIAPEKLAKPEALVADAVNAGVQEDQNSPETAGSETDPKQFDKLKRSRPLDGANVDRQVLEDGTVVTKITPKSRDKSGPIVIDAKANAAQDPRNSTFPDEALVQETPNGKLPVVAADGTRPVERYARPWSGARGTRIAIVVGGLGLSQTGTLRALKMLPEEVTVAFASNGNSLARWMPEARRGGHEVLLQVPLEPFDYPDNDPGPLTLLHSNSEAKNLSLLHKSMAKTTNYTGVMNYLGGRLLADPSALEPVMRDIGERGLLFLDDGSSAQSQSGTYAKAFAMPHAFADIVLDNEVNRSAILKKLDELERVALRKGSAVGVASAFDESVDAVTEWARQAGGRGIEIVGVSALAEVPN
ncbi:divergent polysaccharide deacetylase family protein [Rhizobium sp. KVB221]|uniref:Divergent polysaccharide deacetylase family protein n=1 Tax=Rhizobium setariae TaxID=2801340 RepID=A0A936YQN1_9HYPH|nr:divergent polysaccharide deacetylase family protein [Rhizobium setariae]MBL0374923.1 divergent polysaccharide deacetylase family protein [Rhizobium setariae]